MIIGIDNWEGSNDIDETILLKGGVCFDIIRLNDMNGGHHMDEYFAYQWSQSEYFLRAPYFVYNPWVDGIGNYDWLMPHLPAKGVTRLMIDLEVRYAGYSPTTYSQQVEIFFNKVRQSYPLAFPYTGGGYLDIMTPWMAGDYCWARYPYTFYPPTKENWTWEQLNQKLGTYGYSPDPSIPKKCPGNPVLWQLTGDRLILPGTANRPMDIIAWNGTLSGLETWWGAKMPIAPDVRLDILWREIKLHFPSWNYNP